MSYLDDVDSGLRKVEIDMTLHNVWGGDGYTITRSKTKKLKNRKVSTTRTKDTTPDNPDTGYMKEEQEEEITKNVHTFKIIDDLPYLETFDKKIHGVLHDVCKSLVIEGNKTVFPQTMKGQNFVLQLINQLNIKPGKLKLSNDKDWKNNGNYSYEEIIQKINKRRGTVCLVFGYDCIKQVNAKVVLTFPKEFEKQVKIILARLSERNGDFNKHATTFTINDTKVLN